MANRPPSLRATIEASTKAINLKAKYAAAARAYNLTRGRQESATRELLTFARRLTPSDLQTIEYLNARGGWPAVAQALSQAGLGAEAVAAAGAVAEQGGLPALGQAVSARIQAEDLANLQTSATQELVGFARQLTPEQVALVGQIHAQRGWAAVDAELAAAGLSEAARLVALRTVEQGGLPALGQAVSERIQQEDAGAATEQATQATIDRWTPKPGDSPLERTMKESSPIAKMLRDPSFHTAAQGIARQLATMGLEKPEGKSAAEWVVDTLHTLDGGQVVNGQRKPFDPAWTEAQRLSAATELLGGGSPEQARSLLETFETAKTEHRMLERLAKGDEKRPAAKMTPHSAPRNDVRAAVEKAAAKHGPDRDPPVAVGNGLQATIAIASGRDVDLSPHARKEVQREVDAYTNPKPDTSLRGAIERAVEQESERDETTTTEGGTDE